MYTKKLIPEKSVLSNRLYVRFFCNVQTYEDASLKVMLRWQMYAGRMLYCHNGQCKIYLHKAEIPFIFRCLWLYTDYAFATYA